MELMVRIEADFNDLMKGNLIRAWLGDADGPIAVGDEVTLHSEGYEHLGRVEAIDRGTGQLAVRLMAHALLRENENLRAMLQDQWEWNHDEHCSNKWPHDEGDDCYWPLPVVLGGDPNIYRTYDDPLSEYRRK
jgi:hypothetical protein